MIIKMTDVETNISTTNVDIGDIGSRFYTEDENTAFIRIRINYDGQPVNLNDTDMKPKLDLFMQDGSIFIDEPTEMLIAESGLIQYNIPTKVIKHAGRVSCKLFLDNGTDSVHVANFTFNIVDSGVEEVVVKEVSVDLVKDTVKRIISEDLTNVLDDGFKDKLTKDLQTYLTINKTNFKGDKGDVGATGLTGPQGIQGPKGETGSVNVIDSGWITLPIINGASKYDNTNFLPPSYRVININNMKIVKLYGMFTGLKSNTVFANIPTSIAPPQYIQIKALDRLSSTNCMINITTSGGLTVQGSATDTSAYIIDANWIV